MLNESAGVLSAKKRFPFGFWWNLSSQVAVCSASETVSSLKRLQRRRLLTIPQLLELQLSDKQDTCALPFGEVESLVRVSPALHEVVE